MIILVLMCKDVKKPCFAAQLLRKLPQVLSDDSDDAHRVLHRRCDLGGRRSRGLPRDDPHSEASTICCERFLTNDPMLW